MWLTFLWLIPGSLWLLAFVFNNTLILGIRCSTIPHLPGCFCPCTFFQNNGFNIVPLDPFMSHLATRLGYILQGSYRLCNWLSLRRLVSWINHLLPACWSTLWKSIFKHQLGCRFDILNSISYFLFCILTYAIIYVLIHQIIFWLYLNFLNILYLFKFSCTNIFHRRSLCTFYYMISRLICTESDCSLL